LPAGAPKMVFTQNITTYSHGQSTDQINNYMKSGGTFVNPTMLTESRAVENGSMGIVSSNVSLTASEDLWTYAYSGQTQYFCTYYYSCGRHSTCSQRYYRPIYTWQRSVYPVTENATDTTNITVYTSTAWLKTQGGHIGTNSEFTNGGNTVANYVNLGIPSFTNFLTPSSNYTPPGATNAEYMIFGKNGTGSFESESGASWKVTGTEFPFLQRGEAYDRATNPRDYEDDMFKREKSGEVQQSKLPSIINGTFDLKDDIIWKNSGSITFGRAGVDDTVTLTGGQARIYTDGDVYINANIALGTSSATSYENITSVRIDARNIYVSGEVTDIELQLLARGEFHSGKSKKQLRVLGDVIAGQSFWEREPLEEQSPTEFNKPSEYIIEDMRKYVAPAPGDTQIPDDYTIWRQVNPSTGEVVEGW
jgi:hypothetical protein